MGMRGERGNREENPGGSDHADSDGIKLAGAPRARYGSGHGSKALAGDDQAKTRSDFKPVYLEKGAFAKMRRDSQKSFLPTKVEI